MLQGRGLYESDKWKRLGQDEGSSSQHYNSYVTLSVCLSVSVCLSLYVCMYVRRHGGGREQAKAGMQVGS